MTESADPKPSDVLGQTLKEQFDLLKYLREESQANRDALKFEADANRALLSSTLRNSLKKPVNPWILW